MNRLDDRFHIAAYLVLERHSKEGKGIRFLFRNPERNHTVIGN